ncbi:hypothetical protein HN011_011452 [Eciton burchellii]|nr:hypothetical protein HN011_011452 [Eciton burchellii]
MKAFLLLACLVTILYAADPEKLKAFYKSYHECQKELNLSASNNEDPRILRCVDIKNNLLDENGAVNKEKLLAYSKDLFYPGKENEGEEILSDCIDWGNKCPGTNYNKTIAFVQCALDRNIIHLIVKENNTSD